MTARASVLQSRLARLAPLAEGAVDPGPGPQPVYPGKRMQVLLPHGEEPQPLPVDGLAQRIVAPFRRFARPQRRLRRLARQIEGMRDRHAGQEPLAFDEAMRAMAQRAKFDHSAAAARIGGFELDALALVAEAVFRTQGFYPHQVQFMAAIALLEGQIAEMATGEGKTITAAMAAVVAAWRGLPCHVITANDYLAARDCELGLTLFALCKVSAASITGDTEPAARGPAYAHDIVYTTAKDMLADHLRDTIGLGAQPDRHQFLVGGLAGTAKGQTTMRGIFQLVVDEADSVLIDDAVTPLIISQATPDTLLNEAAQDSVAMARALDIGTDFTVDTELRLLELTSAGRRKLRGLTKGAAPFWAAPSRAEEFVKLALYADHLMQRDRHYVIEDEKVVLVDELTGRLARQRTLSLGLHQVLEASLGLPLSDPSEVQARLSFQRYFRRMPKLGGMTGTAREARGEFGAVYGRTVAQIPTHRKVRRRFLQARVFRTETRKFKALALRAVDLAQAGHAVLIGVRSVRASDALAASFAQHAPGQEIAVLNAINDAEESAIVAKAGQTGGITIATNMAGRGTDIKISDAVREGGGLHVLIAESNDFGRIDRQLQGRCARQGDPGVVQRFVSMDEELIRRFLPRGALRLWGGLHSLRIGRATLAMTMVRYAQWRAERLAASQRAQSLRAEIETEKRML